MFHKVDLNSPTMWWVSVNAFYRQLMDLADRTFVFLDNYDPANPDHVCITFDGIYRNVLRYAAPEMHRRGIPFELFVTSELVGGDNAFDAPEPPAPFADNADLRALVALGGRLQWHTRTHPDLCGLPASRLREEMDVPAWMREIDPAGFRWVAYPYGRSDAAVLEAARANFQGGIACDDGDFADRFRWPRVTAIETSAFRRRRISVIVPCYNYGKFLLEAVDSLLVQTRPPDEILIADDGSTDDTEDVCDDLLEAAPGLIRVQRNETNLGIVDNFNKAVKATSGDYVCLLGADNRFCSDYLERTSAVLDLHPKVGIAYTDFAFFGPRAPVYYREFVPERRGSVRGSYFEIRFPEFDATTRAEFEGNNFIHGSSMYRRAAFDQVGGYRNKKESFEDHQLFLRMVRANWLAKRVPGPLLEYRQHSANQASAALNSELQIAFYRSLAQSRPAQKTHIIELFVDTGSGFNQASSKHQLITAKGVQRVRFDFGGETGIRQLRLDPVNDRAHLSVLRLAIIAADGGVVEVGTFETNARHRDGTALQFANEDPQILFVPPVGVLPIACEVEIDFEAVGRETLALDRLHRRQIAERDRLLAEAAARNEGISRHSAALEVEVAEREKIIKDRDRELLERGQAITARDLELNGLREELHLVRQQLTASTNSLEALSKQSETERAAALARSISDAAEINRSNESLADMASKLSSLDGRYAALVAESDRAEAENRLIQSELRAELSELKDRLTSREEALNESQTELAIVLGSRSWRMTSGFRRLGNALRGFRP